MVTDGRTDGRTDGPTDGPTDRPTTRRLELLWAAKKILRSPNVNYVLSLCKFGPKAVLNVTNFDNFIAKNFWHQLGGFSSPLHLLEAEQIHTW